MNKIILKAIELPRSIEAKKGTAFNDLKFPKEVECEYSNGTKVNLLVTWVYGKYEPDIAGVHVIEGRAALSPLVGNPYDLSTKIEVTLK